MTRHEPRSVVRFLSRNRCEAAFVAVREFVTGAVTTRCGAARVGVGSCGESKNGHDRCDRSVVTTNACYQGQLARCDQKKMLAEKSPDSSRNTGIT